jgi:hypothetical protein
MKPIANAMATKRHIGGKPKESERLVNQCGSDYRFPCPPPRPPLPPVEFPPPLC